MIEKMIEVWRYIVQWCDDLISSYSLLGYLPNLYVNFFTAPSCPGTRHILNFIESWLFEAHEGRWHWSWRILTPLRWRLCWRWFDSMPILHFDEMQGFMIYIALLVNWALFFLKLFKSTTYYMRLMPFIEKTECILHSMRV